MLSQKAKDTENVNKAITASQLVPIHNHLFEDNQHIYKNHM